jgi:6,7-dimethyl-8-ribityllumazine synthase
MTRQTKIAYIQAAWHADITDRCKQAFIAELARHGYDQSGIDTSGVLEM